MDRTKKVMVLKHSKMKRFTKANIKTGKKIPIQWRKKFGGHEFDGKGKTCYAKHPKCWVCSLKKDHDGKHIGWGAGVGDGMCVAVWD